MEGQENYLWRSGDGLSPATQAPGRRDSDFFPVMPPIRPEADGAVVQQEAVDTSARVAEVAALICQKPEGVERDLANLHLHLEAVSGLARNHHVRA